MKLIVWPKLRAEAVTVPPTNPITRAGQHHAPMSAGMERSSVARLTQSAFLEFSGFSSVAVAPVAGSSGSFLLSPLLSAEDEEAFAFVFFFVFRGGATHVVHSSSSGGGTATVGIALSGIGPRSKSGMTDIGGEEAEWMEGNNQ